MLETLLHQAANLTDLTLTAGAQMEWKMVHLLRRFQCLTFVTVVGTVAGCGAVLALASNTACKQRTGGALVRRIALTTASANIPLIQKSPLTAREPEEQMPRVTHIDQAIDS
jgi:hypothetical protein